MSAKILNCRHFNPLPPHGGRPGISFILFTILSFQSTPSAWRETKCSHDGFNGFLISIHSLRMEGDGQEFASIRSETSISIHSLRMEGDDERGRRVCAAENFNPLPPHGGRRMEQCTFFRPEVFQSTPSAWRETSYTSCSLSAMLAFQSTPSAWRETSLRQTFHECPLYFNPLPPHGGRHRIEGNEK